MPCDGPAWRKSSHSEAGNCTEVGQDGAVVLVRDTENPGGPVLTFSAAAWRKFAGGIQRRA